MRSSDKKIWLKMTVAVPCEQGDTLAFLLSQQTRTIVEQSNGTEAGTELLTAYVQQGPEAEAFLAAVHAILQEWLTDSGKLPEVQTELLPDKDWNAEWKKHFKPLHISPGLVITPSWEPYEAKAGEKVIVLDPGMAFGTGHHESTRLVLVLLEGLSSQGVSFPSVLDVGTGTGILAMAAALAGAGRILAIDNDPEALTVARENIEINKLQNSVEVSGQPVDAIHENFSLVMANITSDVLIALASTLAARIAPGGHLILAGILAGTQEQAVCQRYEQEGLQDLRHCRDGEWAALLFAKP